MKLLRNATAAALTVTALITAAPAQADVITMCPSGLTGVATYDTSCLFADNVRLAYYGQPGNTVLAYSPVTGAVYTMTCGPGWVADYWWPNPKRCIGMNDFGVALVVYVA